MSQASAIALGLDFGTESVRALFVDLEGNEKASAVVAYPHGQITEFLPGTDNRLPADFALQHPLDWVESAAQAVRMAVASGPIDSGHVISIGVDFTSCTMLPALERRNAALRREPLGSRKIRVAQALEASRGEVADRPHERRRPASAASRGSTATAGRSAWNGSSRRFWKRSKTPPTSTTRRKCGWRRAIGSCGSSWAATRRSWPAQPARRDTRRSGTAATDFRRAEFFGALNPKLADVVKTKMPGRMLAPGQSAGRLSAAMAGRFGLPAGIPVSAATIDAHAGVPGAGAAQPGTLVMVMGTSSCHMLNATVERAVPGVAGVVEEGILPGYFGYETGQAAVGDAFDWFRRYDGT